MAFRICFGMILLFSVLFLPFWISVILGLFGIVYFSYFFEVFFLFLLSDLFFGVAQARFFDITFVSALIALFVLISGEFIKRKLNFSSKFNLSV